MISIRTPHKYRRIYDVINSATINVDVDEVIRNIYNTFILDTQSFIRTGELDVSLYTDIFDDVHDNMTNDGELNINMLCDIHLSLISLFEGAIVEWFNILRSIGLLNLNVVLGECNDEYFILERIN